MALPTRAYETLASDIAAVGSDVGAALVTANPDTSADMLRAARERMELLSAKVREAADLADLQSRRPLHGRSA